MKYLATTLMLFFIFFESSIQSKEFSIKTIFLINPLEQSYENPEFLDFDYVWDGAAKHKRSTFEEYKSKGSHTDPNGKIVFGVTGNKNKKLIYNQSLNDKLVESNCESIFNSISEYFPNNIRYYLDKSPDGGTIKLEGSFNMNTDWRIFINCFQIFFSKNRYMGAFSILSGHNSDIKEVLERSLIQCDYTVTLENGTPAGKPRSEKFYIDHDDEKILAAINTTHAYKVKKFDENLIIFGYKTENELSVTYNIDRISGSIDIFYTSPKMFKDAYGNGQCKKIEDKKLF